MPDILIKSLMFLVMAIACLVPRCSCDEAPQRRILARQTLDDVVPAAIQPEVTNLTLPGLLKGPSGGEGPVHAAAAARMWDRGHLELAVAVRGRSGVPRLLSRLQAGKPITVLALGTSVTKELGGRFDLGRSVTHSPTA